jgi:hypothetical protein
VQDYPSRTAVAHTEFDPALLAFVKCHITSFVKWDVLRALADQPGYWAEPSQLAREINLAPDKVKSAMADLAREAILEVAGLPEEPIYRLGEGEPTTVVVARLIDRATRSQDLRRLVVAHILNAAIT